MEIRSDFKEVNGLIERLLTYSREFVNYNKERWGYLKNKEDFNQVYNLPNQIRLPLEEVYSAGRNLAISMIYLLSNSNDVGTYPTFASYVHDIEETVEKLLSESSEVISKAEQIISNMDHCPWAVEQMIFLYKTEVNILKSLENWISRAKNTKLYREESGEINHSIRPETMDNKPISQNITTFYGPVGQAQVQQATNSSNQSIENCKVNYEELFNILDIIKKNMEQFEISKGIKGELSSEIATIEAQAKTPKPKNSIISESLNTIRKILEGAGGHIAAQLILQIGNLFV